MKVRYVASTVEVVFAGADLLRREADVRGFYAALDDPTRAAFDALFTRLRSPSFDVVDLPEPGDFWARRTLDDLVAWLVAGTPGTARCTACGVDYDLTELGRGKDATEPTVTTTATMCPKGHVLFNNITSLSY